ncbi:hypothetical protein EXIGLDRAFT_831511 [Exidia glandulosa HHB12029]|uniref:Uncharacterized protein n=1 Tax=Exidia glandulosa HHB12029 TaxID=1314781 RepID=A0A166BAB1_EXIGL|nr:hypothetical protein EXIGLDRAFT_831511 [Exidia glandulosa HHB12029]
MPQDDAPPPDAPKPIHRLDDALVNRIAAGELSKRAFPARKRLMTRLRSSTGRRPRSKSCSRTRSTPARPPSSSSLKDGGLKLLQLRDNDCGIRREDLPILAERFTTSKLAKFDDLNTLETYGFRGEALASISFVAHLSVTSTHIRCLTKPDEAAAPFLDLFNFHG